MEPLSLLFVLHTHRVAVVRDQDKEFEMELRIDILRLGLRRPDYDNRFQTLKTQCIKYFKLQFISCFQY